MSPIFRSGKSFGFNKRSESETKVYGSNLAYYTRYPKFILELFQLVKDTNNIQKIF